MLLHQDKLINFEYKITCIRYIIPDINECSSNPCQHGICYDQVNSYTCSCLVGFTGTNCETGINTCSVSPEYDWVAGCDFAL